VSSSELSTGSGGDIAKTNKLLHFSQDYWNVYFIK